jgi:hypothetical protein
MITIKIKNKLKGAKKNQINGGIEKKKTLIKLQKNQKINDQIEKIQYTINLN